MRFDDRSLSRPAGYLTKILCAVLAPMIAWTPLLAYAQDPEGRYADEEALSDERAAQIRDPRNQNGNWDEPPIDPEAIDHTHGTGADESPASQDPTATPVALPGGAEASAATPQAISLPNAEGSVEGMGESFSPVLSSGTATFSVPIAVAPGRAGVQPSLALSYSTTGGNGPVGFGWNVGAPFIARQTDRGLPRYVDASRWHAEEDRFLYNGGQELVPVTDDDAAALEEAASGVPSRVPADVEGWQQYRARVEGGFMRFFRGPRSERWVVQSKDGTRFDFGLLPAGEGPPGAVSGSVNALEANPDDADQVYMWCLTRMSDPHGSTVYYAYQQDDGRSYLSEIHYVSPASCASSDAEATRRCAAPLDTYASRVHLVYERREDVFAGYTSGWRIGTGLRLKRVEVTAYDDDVGARTLVRRYHLRYAADSFHSLLEEVQVEGRPQRMEGMVFVGDPTVSETSLGERIVGEVLPPMRFRYTRMPTAGDAIEGFGTIDATVHDVLNSPPHSVDEGRSDLFDVNSDGLPDLIVTDPARYRTADGEPAVGVFFNGFTGSNAEPAPRRSVEPTASGGPAGHFSEAVPMPMRAGLSSVLSLSNLNVVPMDMDGDGRSDLLHMPRFRTYGWWAPTRGPPDGAVSPAGQGWRWTYAQIDLPADDTDPRIDLGRDGEHLRILDVNNDHLIDVVRTTGTVMQTWVNLGWLPGGDGRFGSYRWTGSEWALSTEPVESCLLQGGLPIDFEDPEVRIADMNGDGLQDVVQMRRGRLIYWPGRGEGSFGVGPRECRRGEGANRYIEMASPPAELSPELDSVFLSDVNMDGAADVVQVRFREIDVWFNRAGTGWTRRTIARDTPAAPGFAPRIRFADIDGSATTDIIWGNAHDWQYIDPAGGQRPRLLVGVDNGLGADTTIDYGSSADDYLTDLEAARTCPDGECFTWTSSTGEPDARMRELSGESVYRSSGSPVVSTVVRSVSTTDRFNVLGREAQVSESRFAYHDGYYEGIEQEFRGFGAADAVTEGDWNNPTVLSRTHFLQGRRPSDIADDRLAENPNEALKGREVMTEAFDESGAFLSTSFASITDRHLLTGLDGREIHYAFVNETNELRYDTTPFDAGSGTLELGAVAYERFDGSGVVPLSSTTRTIAVRGARVARVRATFDEVDSLGHVLRQTAHGHVAMDGSPIDGVIVSHTEPELLPGGWLWRTRRTFVTGHDAPGALGDTTNTYNAVGDLISATQVVTSPRAYAFGGESPEEGDAAAHVQLDEALVASTVYDAWGNAVQSCAGGVASLSETPPDACLRFGTVNYDPDYAQLALNEHLWVTRDLSRQRTLDYTGTWDRGLGAILGSEDPNHLRTSVTYDGLGRLTSVTPPNVAGCTGARPSTRIAYELTASPASQPISRVRTTTELSCAGELGADVLESIAYVDGLGRARAALATGDDEHAWVRSGITTLDKKRSVRRTYQPDFYDGADVAFSSVVALPADIPYAVTRYDAFGRARGVIAEDGSVVWTSYHSLSTDVCDPLDNDPASEHYRTCTTARTDGHGRVVDQVLRNRDPDTGIGQQHRLWTYYRADGAVLGLVRAESDGARAVHWSAPLPERNVVRTFVYDSVGRRLSSDDPDTDDRTNPDEASNSWRYLFNRVGDLVAVRDPRGCGQNFYYDLGGRLVGEQYVGCGEAQTHRSEQPHGDNLVGDLIANGYSAAPVRLDAVYHYDAYPAWWSDADLPAGHSGVLGRATGVSDRAQRAVLAYDDRGNVTWTARQMAVISDAIEMRASTPSGGGGGGPPGGGGGPPGGTDPSDLPEIAEDDAEDVPIGSVVYDELHTYARTATFDHAGRPRSMLLPEDPDYDGDAPRLGGLLVYNRRGLPAQAAAIGGCDITRPSDAWVSDVGELSCSGGDVHTIVGAIEYLRDGLVASITYGDDLGGARAPTRSTTRYDRRRRPVHMRTERERTTPLDPLEPTLGAVTVVFDQELVWDAANNLVAQLDHRDPAEWPDGHRPQSVNVRHDALYRVVGAEYDYTQNDRSRRPEDIGTDWREEFGQSATVDPMRQEPAPMAPARAPDRVRSLTWSWDYLANTTEWTDDASSFYERSIGGITNGDDIDDVQRPSALYLASNIGDGTGLESGGGGYVEVEYGAGGNLTTMVVHAQCGVDSTCVDPGTELSTRLSALHACECANEQRYEYRWDELNRLSEARRFDRTAAMGGRWDFAIRQRYRYDAANQRTVKQTLDQEGCRGGRPGGPPTLPSCERIALYVYPGDFERRGIVRDGDVYAADEVLGTETQYVVAGARWVERSGGIGADGFDRERRLTVRVSDLIQTTASVMDVRSGVLVESSTYYPTGGRETFLNDDTALTAPEVAGFTGKEADEEVGIVYFGERYLVSRLGRWASPDPLHVHASGGGEALNSYHYVGGNMLAGRDPFGLECGVDESCASGFVPPGDAANQSGPEGARVGRSDAPIRPPEENPPGIGPRDPNASPGVPRRAAREAQDQRYRSGDAVTYTSDDSFTNFLWGLGNVALTFGAMPTPRFAPGDGTVPEHTSSAPDLLAALEDAGVETGGDRHSTEYGLFTTGPNLQDAALLSASGLFGRTSATVESGVHVQSSGGSATASLVRLTRRQRELLAALPGEGAATTVPRRLASMRDVLALSESTGSEFAVLTRGGERMVIRGRADAVPTLTGGYARQMGAEGWRFSAHTHPVNGIQPSLGDRIVADMFGGSGRSMIMRPGGGRTVYDIAGSR